MSVQLHRLFSEDMVLQRGKKVTIWGQADQPVRLSFQGQEAQTLPDTSGRWSVSLESLQPGGPYTLTANEVTLHRVYVGEVWLCTGQSNMQLALQRVKYRYPEEMAHPIPHIFQFTVPQRTDFTGPQADLAEGSWLKAHPDTISAFSAVGYFFAKRLFQRFGVPIGLIQCAIGGTPIHAWMSREALAPFPDLLDQADQCADPAYVAQVQASDAAEAAGFFRDIDRTDPGLAQHWEYPGYDDSDWALRPLTAPFEGTGSFWLRKTLVIPPHLVGKPAKLFLGTLVDCDWAFVNGQPVGNTTYRYPPREYDIPALPEGQCTLAVRAISKQGGGFTPGKPYLLATQEGAVDLDTPWRFRAGGMANPPKAETFFHYKPTGLYHGMFTPLGHFAIAGAVWYQGESDAANPSRYAEKCAALLRCWRKDFGWDFPFCFVELAHWEQGDWAALRAQQRQVLHQPHTAMAAGFDLGEHNDLHPLGKQTVGDRLARCALRIAYGEHMPPSPFEVVAWQEGV